MPRSYGQGLGEWAGAGDLGQATLFTPAEEGVAGRRTQVTDLIREKLGDQATTRARMVKKKNRQEAEEASSLPSVD